MYHLCLPFHIYIYHIYLSLPLISLSLNTYINDILPKVSNEKLKTQEGYLSTYLLNIELSLSRSFKSTDGDNDFLKIDEICKS